MTKLNVFGEAETALKSRRTKKNDFRHHLFIESFGVKIGIASNQPEAIETVRKTIDENFPGCVREIEKTEVKHQFLLVWNKSEKDSLYKDGKIIYSKIKRENMLEYFMSELRRLIAEFAVG